MLNSIHHIPISSLSYIHHIPIKFEVMMNKQELLAN